jgi:hypothetical protein
MKYINHKIHFFISFIAILLISSINISCDGIEDSENDQSVLSYEIYYRWTEDLYAPSGSNAGSCNESVAKYYNNSHPDIPDNAVKNQFYKVSPEAFSINLSSIGGGTTTKYINAPANGYRRYYTHMIKKYWPATNRCLIVMNQEDAFTYIDEPIK